MRHDEPPRDPSGPEGRGVLLTGRCHREHDLVLWCRQGRLRARAGREQHEVGPGAALHIAAGTPHDVRVPDGSLVHPVFLTPGGRRATSTHHHGVDRRLAAALLTLHVAQVTELRPPDDALERLNAQATRALLHGDTVERRRVSAGEGEPPRSLVQWVVNPPGERVTLLACFGAADVQVRTHAGAPPVAVRLTEGMALDVAGGVEHRILTDGGVVLPAFHPGSPGQEDSARLYYLPAHGRRALGQQLVARTTALRPHGWDERRLTRTLDATHQQVTILGADHRPASTAERLLAAVIAAPGTRRCPASEGGDARGRRSLERDVRHLTGQGFVAWRTRARCEQGLDLMAAGMTVQQAARRVGYAHASAFSRAFQQSLGQSPTAACDELLAGCGPW